MLLHYTSPEHPADPYPRFFSNAISIVFLGSLAYNIRASSYYPLEEECTKTSCYPVSRISSVLYSSFICPLLKFHLSI
ncbi:Bgt-50916 [Blumeria graminis f. sp. tritici]|uniref:Bgt-50916 n=1 Tax=Blumeria graminis f. sp. tritici TaxID=62690 RepID=A0A9X9L967_BLUGR|nr:Bgt-50916 [Blumeria graminis f. sp. tritici]